ncbi:insulin receptor-related protein [Microplitis demolitor]|uniref:insulin receptor-related protein n=1 Tax=Microplitis demolitor TaxID=69319 RepID=UPI0004CC9029|nr:insulin receptor-related protein [Microplitis demolitor]XP_008551857.1 insulin receptor-related protein [Microplitis demolitor]XP_008551858.1 insulin receptor-related protein [Microplitis demolitor]XP_008551859.1 insulin receptor-related protein [Microplitis demolitor]
MKTRKLLLPVLLTLGIVFFLALPSIADDHKSRVKSVSKRYSKSYSKHRDKTSKGKYDPELDDRAYVDTDQDTKHIINDDDIDSFGYRSNRAIDVSSSNNGNSSKNGQQVKSNLPNETLKMDKKISTKPRKLKNVTIANGICQSIDIRNRVRNFEILKDCEIIEGFLQIVLIDNNTEADFEGLSFPKLREITSYMMLYRINNLLTLRHLFPNLEVIRGDKTILDYSFMIYELPNLEEIGLTKLTKILRGAVRIEKNPELCYASTIDWNEIVVNGENFIKDNQNPADCRVNCSSCPGKLCWNENICQKTKKPVCHEECLSDCFGPSDKDCFVCKNYRFGGRCVSKCPDHLYAYSLRRCITAEECLKLNIIHKNEDERKQWRAFNGLCLDHCPIDFEERIDQNNVATCKPCNGTCRRIGYSGLIRHISDLQRYQGTTFIDGNLEFQIHNGIPNIIEELTNAFGLVEEITGYLKITHSFPIVSLDFFKNLRIIGGKYVEVAGASVIALDNPNLSSLFPESQKVKVLNGRLFFHYNPRLCMSKIISFAKSAGIKNYTEIEIQPDSNGEKVACDIVNINLTIKQKGPNNVDLEWEIYKPSEGQRLLSYLLSYVETNNENVTFEGNSCGDKHWRVLDVEIPLTDSPNAKVSKSIVDLKPYTKYAAYVKTLAARDKNSFRSPTGQSEIIYFITAPDIPSVPLDIKSYAKSDSEIVVEWNPPEQPNGPIQYYIIRGYLRSEDRKFLLTRNYCTNGLINEVEEQQVPEVTIKTPISVPHVDSCCLKDSRTTHPIETVSKRFEIFCIDNTTVSYTSNDKKNYCRFNQHPVNDNYKSNYHLNDNLSGHELFESSRVKNKNIIDDKKTRIYNDTYYSFVFNISANINSYNLKKLYHFSLYTISVTACGVTLKNGTHLCSSNQYTSVRTKSLSRMDDIDNIKINVLNDTIVLITWDAVNEPNGITVSYTIEYTNLDVQNAKKNSICIPENVNRKKRNAYTLTNLTPGKYSARLRSTSLSGNGNWSQINYFSIGIKDKTVTVIIISVVLSCFVVAFVVSYIYYLKFYKIKQTRIIASVNPDYIESKYVKDSWEVSRDNLVIGGPLGNGNFGRVFRGKLNGVQDVAIKTITEKNYTEEERHEFLNEASVMKQFTTYHIVKLVGVISEGDPPYVIMELMEKGDLKSYLRENRDILTLDVPRIVRMAGEIADGMAYLESKKFVHRDLAARNCMVSKGLVCKIGDFGMARDIYETDYYKIGQKGLLPIRWMAPENLSDGVFTSCSDVWSFGIVLYEILTMGELPYQGFSNDDVLNHVLRKGVVSIPRNCPDIIIKLMEKCFKWRPDDRPTFMDIVAELEPFLEQDFCEKSFYHSDEGVALRSVEHKKIYHNAAQFRFHWGNDSTARWVREFEDNVTLLDQTATAGVGRNRKYKNGFQQYGSEQHAMVDIPLDR